MKCLLALVNSFCTICELLCNIMSHCTHKLDRCSHRTASLNCFPALCLCSNWGSHALVYCFKILTVTGQCFNVMTVWRYWPSSDHVWRSPDRVWRSPDKLSRACHSPDMFSCTRQISRAGCSVGAPYMNTEAFFCTTRLCWNCGSHALASVSRTY